MSHYETNPHFNRPLRQPEGQHAQPPPSTLVLPPQQQSRQNQPIPLRGTRHQGQRSKPQGPRGGEHEDDVPFRAPRKDAAPRQPQHPHTPPQHPQMHPSDSQPGVEYHSPWVMPPRHPSEDHHVHDPSRGGEYQSPWVLPPQHRNEDPRSAQLTRKKPRDRHPQQLEGTGVTPQDQDHDDDNDHHPLHPRPTQAQQQDRHHPHGLRAPAPQRTPPITWLAAAFCAIFWIVIFLGGLIVLIVYLVYRPRSPRFEVSSVTLNAAYIDAGALLNADMSVLANFTNPNKKAGVDFSHMIIDLYYGNTLIATQYIESFSAAKSQSMFANVHMVTSQVRLPLGESVQLQEQINKNGIIFNIKAVFRVRSNLGSFLRYSYKLYGHCTFMVTAPPSGILRATRCKTKR